MVSAICRSSTPLVAWHVAYSLCMDHSVVYNISKIKGLPYCHRINNQRCLEEVQNIYIYKVYEIYCNLHFTFYWNFIM